jgi:hypothetical protein
MRPSQRDRYRSAVRMQRSGITLHATFAVSATSSIAYF